MTRTYPLGASCWPSCNADVDKDNLWCKSLHCGNCPWAEVGCWQCRDHQWWHRQQALVWLPVVPERAVWWENCAGQPRLSWHVVGVMQPTTTRAEGNCPTKNNNQPFMGAVQWWKMMEQAADNQRGRCWVKQTKPTKSWRQQLTRNCKNSGKIGLKYTSGDKDEAVEIWQQSSHF